MVLLIKHLVQNNGGSQRNNPGVFTDADSKTKYKNGDPLYGLRPYVFYSCRYKLSGTALDVVITYALDNYIVIQGTDRGGDPVNISGYLLSDVNDDGSMYRGVSIPIEDGIIKQNVYDVNLDPAIYPDEIDKVKSYNCRKVDGVKYYYNDDYGNFSYLNNDFLPQNNGLDVVKNDNAQLYYKEAAELKKAIKNISDPSLPKLGLNDLKVSDAYYRDEEGNEYKPWPDDNTKIFEELDNTIGGVNPTIEEPNSKFNQHRLQVIRKTVEDNLAVAISNYSNSLGYNFNMPRLSEEDWEKVLNNISIISFLQGLSIGGKIYNGYTVIPNNENEDVVTENSIYIIGDDYAYHKINETDLFINTPESDPNITARGVYNADLEIHSIISGSGGKTIYYIPKGAKSMETDTIIGAKEFGSYDSIITSSKVDTINADSVGYDNNMYKYVDGLDSNLKKIYYTALARERYGTYKGAKFTVDLLEYSSSSTSFVSGSLSVTTNNDADASPWLGDGGYLAKLKQEGKYARGKTIEVQASDINSSTEGKNSEIGDFSKDDSRPASGTTSVTIPAGSFAWPYKNNNTYILPYNFSGSDDFGPRNIPNGSRYHDGIDIHLPGCGTGTNIYAAAGGTVTKAGLNGGYGYYVEIDHGSNGIHTFYGHMQPNLEVKQGDKVKLGQLIGHQGGTGLGGATTYGSHLHFGCSIGGKPADPLQLFRGVLDIKYPSNPEGNTEDGYIRMLN